MLRTTILALVLAITTGCIDTTYGTTCEAPIVEVPTLVEAVCQGDLACEARAYRNSHKVVGQMLYAKYPDGEACINVHVEYVSELFCETEACISDAKSTLANWHGYWIN